MKKDKPPSLDIDMKQGWKTLKKAHRFRIVRQDEEA
jgi:hypothetical protein